MNHMDSIHREVHVPTVRRWMQENIKYMIFSSLGKLGSIL